MAERRFPYPVAWGLFLVLMFTGAGLLLSPDPTRRAWGLGLILAPLGAFGVLMALFYWRSRRDADAP